MGQAGRKGECVVNWRRPLLIVFASLMEMCWFYPWLALLGSLVTRQDSTLKPALVFVLFFLVQGVAGLLNRWHLASRYQRIVVGGLVLLTVLLMIRAHVYPGEGLWRLRWIGTSLANLVRVDPAISRELFLTLATFAIWWRSLRMNQRWLSTDTVSFQFRLGILLLIVLLIAQALSYRQDMTGYVLSLFLCGLVSVALARAKEGVPARREARWLNLRWLFSLLVVAGGTLLIGLLVSALFSAGNLTTVWEWLLPVRRALAVVFLLAVWAVSYVLIWIVNAVFGLFFRGKPQQLETVTLSPLQLPAEWLRPDETVAPAWGEMVQRGLVALMVVALFVLLLVAVRRWTLRPSGGSDMWRESVWSSREVGRGLLAGLQNRLRHLAGLWSGREARQAYSVATIRKIYASLLALAEQRGVPRPPAQTPLEYLPTLQSTFPVWGAELQVLTRAYVDAHYGQLPDTEAELQALRDAWQHIRTWAEVHSED